MKTVFVGRGAVAAVSLLASTASLYSDTSSIRNAAEQNALALMVGDFETVASGTYLQVVASLGGSLKMAELLKSVSDQA